VRTVKDALIKIRNVTKRYGKTVALRDVSLEIGRGITGLVGPNGAGKTTLINIIVGLIEKDSGKVIIKTGKGDFRESIGVIRDRIAFPPELEVEYFLTKIAEMYGMDASYVKHVIDIVGLREMRHKRIGALSMGYKKRVGIAQAVVHEPILIIADEPFTQLDPLIKVEIRDTIHRLSKEEGINFFISSHDIADLEVIADRVILINRGRIVKTLEKGGVLSIMIRADNVKKLKKYLLDMGFRAQIDGLQVRVDVRDMKPLLGVLYNYDGQIYGINSASIEGAIKDELA